jgi:hypothetical protein
MVTIGRYESGLSSGYFDVRDSTVKLIKGSVISGTNKAAGGTEWPIGSPVAAVYGSPTDLWGVSWTPEDITASNFGVALSVISDVNRIAYVDYIQVSVTYSVTMVGSNTTVNCGGGTPAFTYGSSITCVATVTRGSGTKTPTGSVNWTSNGSGNFVTSPCALTGADGTSTCSVTYTATAVGTGAHLITAAYSGDPDFFSGSGSQTVTVNKKPITITPNDGQSKAYGAVDPTFAFTPSPSLASGDSFTGGLGRATGETIGTYAYTLGDLSAGANYTLTLAAGHTFEIVKAIATVTLSNLTQTYDGSPKSVTVTTNPTGLTVDVTYAGSSTPPSAVGNYAVIATVTDPNYSGSANGTLVIQQTTATHSIPLSVGWNLVSFNVHPANTAIATVLSSISGNYNLVYAWDATGAHSSSGNWVKYAPPPAPPYANTLANLDETMGFWIRMTAADTLEVTGTVPVTTTVNLYANAGGWNLVGYPAMANRPLPAALSSNGVGTNFSLVYSFRAIDLTDPWKLFNRTGAPYANDLTELVPGWGYWVKVIVNSIWNVQYLP